MKTKWIFILVLVILFAILLIQNTQVVIFRLYFWRIAVSEVILVPLLILVGIIIGFLLAKVRKSSNKPKNEISKPS